MEFLRGRYKGISMLHNSINLRDVKNLVHPEIICGFVFPPNLLRIYYVGFSIAWNRLKLMVM